MISERRLRYSRRQLLHGTVGVLGTAAGASIIAACGGGQAPTEAPKPAAPAAAAPTVAAQPATGKPVTLKVIYWSSSPEDHLVFEQTFKGFQDKNPNITVNFDDIPSDEFAQKALTMIVGGTPPDAMELHPAWVMNFVMANQLTELTEIAKSDKAAYIPAQLDFWSNQGKLYGIPYYSGPSFLFYNKTLFKKHGAKTPEEHEKAGTWTWATLQQLAKQVTAGTGADKTFGWDAATNAVNLQFYTCQPVWCAGGDLVNKEETEWLLDSPPVLEVMQWHADMFLKDKSIPLPSDMQGINWIFRTGKVGMAWAGRFRSLELVNAEFDVGMVSTPKGKTGSINRDGPNATGLPIGTKNVDAAYKLATFIGGPDGAPLYMSSGRTLPVQTALLDSEIFKKSLKPYERLDVLVEASKTVRAWRIPGKGAEELRTIQTEWENVLVGKQDVPTAMKAAKAAMNPLLKVR
jgi:multiple sugar transport system substrate-binding protein